MQILVFRKCKWLAIISTIYTSLDKVNYSYEEIFVDPQVDMCLNGFMVRQTLRQI